ncbi:MAG: conjugal transfer protein TraX, partial [Treponema sp.]|nr:conjugal transfer protein TraX [Treponema sp.]
TDADMAGAEAPAHWGFTANRLKVLAIALMFLDHFVVLFLPADALLRLLLRVPGRIVAPIFCFLIAEGYRHTSNKRAYVLRLLGLAVISHAPFNLAFGHPLLPSAGNIFPPTSVIWALSMGLVALSAIKSEKIRAPFKPLILAACCLAAYTANWNFVAVLWICAFGFFSGDFRRQIAAFCAIAAVFHLAPVFLRHGSSPFWYLHLYQLGVFLALPILAAYNGRLGKKSKTLAYAFYLFYPAHLVALHLLNRFTSLAYALGVAP